MSSPPSVAAVSAFVASEYASEGLECAGTDGNIVHVQLPAVTENVTEVVTELYARFGAEADVVLTPKGANLVVYVPADPPAEPKTLAVPWRMTVAGALLGVAALGLSQQLGGLPAEQVTTLPPNLTSYIWPW